MLRSSKRSRNIGSITIFSGLFAVSFLLSIGAVVLLWVCHVLMTEFLNIAKPEMKLSPEEMNLICFGTRHGNNSISYACCLYCSGMQRHVKTFGGAEHQELKRKVTP